jgi:hypothetical protein
MAERVEPRPAGQAAPRERGLSPAVACGILALIAALGGVVCFAFGGLLFRGELRLPGEGPAPSRVWLVREGENEGLAASRSRLVSGSEAGPRACVETTVSFWLWRSDDTAVPGRYCECYEVEAGEWASTGDCPP